MTDNQAAEAGKCLCGAISFRAENVETHVHACHCSMCRAWAGSPVMAANVGSVTFEGEDNLARFASSEWAERGFCKLCGSNLFYHLREPDLYMMNVGTFDNAEAFKLAGEIYIDEKPSGYAFAGDHPRLTGEEFLQSMGVPQDS